MPAQTKSNTGPRMLKVREWAEYLRVHQATVYRLLRQQKLPAFRVGADWRFNREEIERWMTQRTETKLICVPRDRTAIIADYCRRMGNPAGRPWARSRALFALGFEVYHCGN